jgi:thiamine kinase-like enzyme
MTLFSLPSVLEYLLGLRASYSSALMKSSFKKDLDDLDIYSQNLKVTDLKSATRHLVYEFELNNKRYVLKQFREKKEGNEESIKKNSSNHFENEKEIIKSGKWDSIIPYFFIDDFNKIIIQEHFLSVSLIEVLKLIREDNDKGKRDLCPILKVVAEKLKEIHQKSPSSVQPFIRDRLNNSSTLINYYKKYVDSWKGDSLIHGDLFLGKNILSDKQDKFNLRMIDWELSRVGDIYYDLCAVVYTLCINSFKPLFHYIHVPAATSKFVKLKNDIDCFLNAYDPEIKREKLKAFLIINTQKEEGDISEFLKNIDILFP